MMIFFFFKQTKSESKIALNVKIERGLQLCTGDWSRILHSRLSQSCSLGVYLDSIIIQYAYGYVYRLRLFQLEFIHLCEAALRRCLSLKALHKWNSKEFNLLENGFRSESRILSCNMVRLKICSSLWLMAWNFFFFLAAVVKIADFALMVLFCIKCMVGLH